MGIKLRIAMLGQRKVPSREGGIEVVVEELAKRMVKLGYEVTCLNRSRKHINEGELAHTYQGITIKSVWTYNKRGIAAMTSAISATFMAAFGKYDIVHFHAVGACNNIWLPKLLGKRCIVTVHGLDWQRAKWGRWASAYIKKGEKAAVKYADEMIVLSENTKQYFKNVYKRDIKFIPNGANAVKKKEAKLIKEQFGLDYEDYILFVGRLVPEKGIQYLIEAFKGVDTNKKLVIAGGAADMPDFMVSLKQMAGGSDKEIIFTDFVQGELLAELYSNAYMYVLPSDVEGMPLTLIEAMSYGNCCVVSDIPECTEVVEDKAVIFKKGEVWDLQNCLQKLCDKQEEVDYYRQHTADFIGNKHNWDEVVDKTLRLYQGVD